MINISKHLRKALRTIFRGIGISVVSLIIQACYSGTNSNDQGFSGAYGMPAPAYGMSPPNPPIEKASIYGKIVAKETGNPIIGIQVSVEETELWDRTDKYGWFSFWVPVQDEYIIKFEDIDGPYNDGLFKGQTWTLKQDDTNKTLLIGMDIDTE